MKPDELMIAGLATVFTLLVTVVGCEPDPAVRCDYCHAIRTGVKRYSCTKCSSSHSVCSVDYNLLHWDREGKWSTNPRLDVCPSAEDLASKEPPPPAVPPAVKESRQKVFTESKVADLVIMFIAMGLTFLMGYGRGRDAMKKKLLGKGCE